MISNQYKLILFDIPATAGGNLFQKFLKNIFATGEYNHIQTNTFDSKPESFFELCNSSEMNYIKHDINEVDFNNYYKIAIVRNPWDRLVALYNCYKLLDPKRCQFIKPELIKQIQNSRNFSSWVKSATAFPRDQFSYISKENILLANYVARYETVQKDFEYLFSGFPGLRCLGSPNYCINSVDYRLFYDSVDIDIVGKQYSNDIAVFNYDFGGVNYRPNATPSVWGMFCNLQVKNLNYWCRIKDPGCQGMILHPNMPEKPKPVVAFQRILVKEYSKILISAIANDEHKRNPGAILFVEIRANGKTYGQIIREILPRRAEFVEMNLPQDIVDLIFSVQLRESTQSNCFSAVQINPIDIINY